MNITKIYNEATKTPEDPNDLKQQSDLEAQQIALKEAAKSNRQLWNQQDTTIEFRRLLTSKIQEYEVNARNIFFNSDLSVADKAANLMVRSETLRKVVDAMNTGKFEDLTTE